MPRYGDDQCEECGGIRVNRPALCVDCLVKAVDREIRKKHVLQVVIDKRDMECAVLRRQLEDALAYGFKQNQANVQLNQYIKEIEKRIHGRWKNEKDGVCED